MYIQSMQATINRCAYRSASKKIRIIGIILISILHVTLGSLSNNHYFQSSFSHTYFTPSFI